MKSLTTKPWGLADACVAIAFISLFFVQADGFARDPGVGWHLKTGAFIWKTWSVPDIDLFLSFAAPRPWVSDQWLSDLLFHFLYVQGSWPLLFAVISIVFCGTFLWFLYRGVVKSGVNYLAAALSCIIAFKLAQVHFILRPVVFAFLFFVFLYVRVFALQMELKVSKTFDLRRCVFILAPLFCLWANMHPSFVLGLLLLVLLPLGQGLDFIFFERAPAALNRALLVKLIALIFICFAATLINPYFFDLHVSIFKLANNSYFMSLNEEWHSPNFQEYSGFLLELVIFGMVACVLLTKQSGLAWGSFEILALLLFAHLTFQSIRVMPFFGIILSIPLAQVLQSLKSLKRFQELPVLRLLWPAFSGIENRERHSHQGRVLLSAFSIVLLWIGIFRSDLLSSLKIEVSPPRNEYPYGALEFLTAQSFSEQGVVVAASPNWGGFITLKGHPQIRAIIDDRNTMLGEKFYREFFNHLRPGGGWQSYLTQFNTTHLLLSAKSALAQSLLESGKLAVLHRDEVAILFRYE